MKLELEATVIKSEINKDGAVIYLEEGGNVYKAVMEANFIGNIRYMRENTKHGQDVRIQFTKAENGDLIVYDIWFLAE